MKKHLFATALACIALSTQAYAQDEFDALRLTQQDIRGTARYTAMGGAFGALGGDVSAIKDNPAGLGVYRKSEITLSLGQAITHTAGTWNSLTNNRLRYRPNITQTAFVLNFGDKGKTTGLITSSLAFSYNQLKNYNRRIYLKGQPTNSSMTDLMALQTNIGYADETSLGASDAYDNTQQSWLSVLAYNSYLINPTTSGDFSSLLDANEKVSSSYSALERGSMDEYGFSWGGNISNVFFLGAGLNVRTLTYRLESTYKENFEKGGNFALNNSLRTTGTGINFNFGVMGMPADFLRLGASVQTSTFWTLEDKNDAALNYNSTSIGTQNTPIGSLGYNYDLNTPFRANGSAAFILGKKGLIGVEYEFNRYKGMKLADPKNDEAFFDVNQAISDFAKNTHAIKIGAEFKPKENIALRVGYAHQSGTTKADAERWLSFNTVRTDTEYSIYKGTDYASAGIGFRGNIWFFDLAYQCRMAHEDYFTYGKAVFGPKGTAKLDSHINTAATLNTQMHNVVATIGFRF